MYYIYILYSAGSDKYYLGYSDNPQQRLHRHNNSSHVTFTYKHRPWEMKAIFEVSGSRNEAIRIERYLKKQKSRRLLEELIQIGNLEEIKNIVLNGIKS